MALSVAALGTMHYIRSTQDVSRTTHALTQAQMKAWNGVDAFRQYLYQVSGTSQLPTAGSAIALSGMSGISGTVVQAQANTSACQKGTQITANITGTSGGANATVQSVYCVGSASSATATLSNMININGNLQLTGSVQANAGTTGSTSFMVNGDITSSGSIGGFNLLYATGTINLNGGASANVVAAQGDVNINATGQYMEVKSMKNVMVSNRITVGTITSNGLTTLVSSDNVTKINAIGGVKVGPGSQVDTISTYGDANTSSSTITRLNAQGNVLEDGGTITTLNAQGNFTQSSSGGSVSNGTVGGSVSIPSWNGSKVHVTQSPWSPVSLTPLTLASIQTATIDAWPLKSAANYVFDVDAQNNMQVTVSNVNTIPDGTYYLTGSDGNQDWLCTTKTYNANQCVAKICNGFSAYNSCFSYVNGAWKTDGATMAPGVVWFHGDLNLGVGTYENTVIATGNITTSGSTVVHALNYGGASEQCSNAAFPALYPTNFCSAGAYTPSAIGNVALLAGGYQNNTFSGGNISLGASNSIFGDILAGGILSTGGSTSIQGYITVANQGGNSSGSAWGASTTIDVSQLPSTFNPGQIPNQTTGGSNGTPSVSVVWTRYL